MKQFFLNIKAKGKALTTKQRVILLVITTLVIIGIVATGHYYHVTKEHQKDTPKIRSAFEYQGQSYIFSENRKNYLVLGIDKNEAMTKESDRTNGIGQADSIFIASVDEKGHKVDIIAIPRDTMVNLYIEKDKQKQKANNEGSSEGFNDNAYQNDLMGQINLQYAYGLDGTKESCRLMKKQVENLMYDIPIHGVVSLNLSCITVLNDALGGVDVIMPEDLLMPSGQKRAGELVHLEGEDAFHFVQYRDTNVEHSAMGRLGRQKIYLESFAAKAAEEIKAQPTLAASLLMALNKDMYTDISTKEITSMIQMFTKDKYEMGELFVLPGELTKGEKYEEYYLNQEEVKKLLATEFCEPLSAE